MTTAEVTVEKFKQAFPNSGIKMVYLHGTAVQNDDFFTVDDEIATVSGVYLIATDGTVGTCTFTTSVIVVTNAGTKEWTGFAWGI